MPICIHARCFVIHNSVYISLLGMLTQTAEENYNLWNNFTWIRIRRIALAVSPVSSLLQSLPDREVRKCLFVIKCTDKIYEISASDKKKKQEWIQGIQHSFHAAL